MPGFAQPDKAAMLNQKATMFRMSSPRVMGLLERLNVGGERTRSDPTRATS